MSRCFITGHILIAICNVLKYLSCIKIAYKNDNNRLRNLAWCKLCWIDHKRLNLWSSGQLASFVLPSHKIKVIISYNI